MMKMNFWETGVTRIAKALFYTGEDLKIVYFITCLERYSRSRSYKLQQYKNNQTSNIPIALKLILNGLSFFRVSNHMSNHNTPFPSLKFLL